VLLGWRDRLSIEIIVFLTCLPKAGAISDASSSTDSRAFFVRPVNSTQPAFPRR
jgi:hypothetical protein